VAHVLGKEIKVATDRTWYDSNLTNFMERRAYARIPVNLQVRLFYGNLIYTGIVKDLSENGMFISTRVKFPINSVFMIVVLINNKDTVKMPIKVKRTVDSISHASAMKSGMGVELLNVPPNYLDYVSKLKLTH
jgi:Tfp pilus assembly protein PilZ